MGIYSGKLDHARHGNEPCRRNDRREPPPRLCRCSVHANHLILSLLLLLLVFAAPPLGAQTLRVASYNVELYRKGPGLMLRDILRGDPQAEAAARVIVQIKPDIILLQGVDFDAQLHGFKALRNLISERGLEYPHIFAAQPNTGLATGLDLNGDGKRNGPADAQGFGFFSGQRGMVLLSRWPIAQKEVQDFSDLLWRDLPDALLPKVDGTPFPSQRAQNIQRLSSTGHWIVPVELPDNTVITLMGFAATPPVFDGPEDRNGLRNADEIRLWNSVLDGELGEAPDKKFFVLGTANLDPNKGQGRHVAIETLLRHSKLQDPQPTSKRYGLNTVDWPEPGPGSMRVDYVLPSSDWRVTGAGVVWPDALGDFAQDVSLASRHRLVWVDVVAP